MKLIQLIFFLLILCAFKASNNINYANHCKLTKGAINNYEPEKFNPSNNLLRYQGDITFEKNDKITINGVLHDNFCVPVQDAKIYLWQANQKGKYTYKILRKKFTQEGMSENPSEKFQGSGIATTNNNGEFSFTTIFPGSQGDEHPNINIRVEHRVLGNLQTKIYLKKPYIKTKTEKTKLKFNLAKENLIPTKDPQDSLIIDDFLEELEEKAAEKHKLVNIYKITPGYDMAFPDSNGNYNIEIIVPGKKNYKRY